MAKMNGAAVAGNKPNAAEKFKKGKKGAVAKAAEPVTPKAILNVKQPKNKKGVDILAKMKQGKQSSSEEEDSDEEESEEEAAPANGKKAAPVKQAVI
jgi:ribosomal 50S subunit-recycling heat shock protein